MASRHSSDEEDIEDKADKRKSDDTIVFEFEEELDEYDLPDVYPSEKDYKWFEDTVTDSEEEEEPVRKPIEEVKPVIVKTGESGTLEQEEGVKSETAQTTVESGKTEAEEGVEDEDEFIPTMGVDHDDQEEETTQRKRYKTIKVRRLVERPPKIYHVADRIRIQEVTNSDDFSTPPFNFIHSFGYDCQRLGNLIVLDNTTLLFMSGFVLTFYNHKTFEKTYMRSLGGGSFGSIALHPSKKLFAAAEKSTKPVIGIWSWPKLQLFRILEEGTERVYASVNFSPDGKLLSSQGGEPDYLITVWNWLAQAPILRVKSHVQDVYRITFAKELAGLLTTSGLCHIKFWKMAGTFTGLKLKGDIGRFGRTELSDIEGYVEMPDGKVLSGTEWGNLLVWENGLVIAELCTANSAPCHVGIVRQILMVEGDFFTTGQDGLIKVWRYEDVDTAEIHTTMESLKVSVKPVTNVTINDEGDIWSIFPDPYNNDDVSVYWFAQDGKGLIWLVDLSFLNIAKEPKVVLTAHGGPIADSAMSPEGHLIATLGGDGKLIVHDYITKQIVAMRSFSAPGSCLLWPSHGDNHDGCMMIAGFDDGVLRIILLSGKPSSNGLPKSLCLHIVCKPHRSKVTTMVLDSEGEFLVTGSEDATIFFFDANKNFTPMCYIDMPYSVSVRKVLWSTGSVDTKIVIAICNSSLIQEVEMPSPDDIDNTTTYCYKDATFLRNCTVRSIKSVLRHNEELNMKQKDEDDKQAGIERENQRLIDDGIETQEEQDGRLLEEALELEKSRATDPSKEKTWKPYIPLIPNNILVAFQDHLDSDVMHLTMDDYDAGYIYSVRLMSEDAKRNVGKEAEEPFDAIPIVECDDVPTSQLVFANGGTKVFLGFKDGRIRMSPLEFEFELESMKLHWTMGAHDIVRGDITSITINQVETTMFTTGKDGNCFMFTLTDDESFQTFVKNATVVETPIVDEPLDIHDIVVPDAYTLEDSKNVEKERARMAAAKKNKAAKREKIAHLRFRFAEILSRNNELPAEIRLTPVELSVASDNFIRCQERYDQALQTLKFEMAWHCEFVRLGLEKVKSFFVDRLENQLFVVKAFSSDNKVSSFRLSKYPIFFENAQLKARILEDSKLNVYEHTEDDGGDEVQETMDEEPRPKRRKGMNKFVHQKLVRVWERQQKKQKRKKEWDDFLKTDPSEQELVDDMDHIHEAQQHIGDMKLKIDPNYKIPESRRLTVLSARKNLICLEEKMFEYQKEFNNELIGLRNRKVKVISHLNDIREKIRIHQDDIPGLEHLLIPAIPTMTTEEDPNALLNFTRDDVLLFQQKLQARLLAEGSHLASGQRKADPQKRRRKSWNAQKNEGEEDISRASLDTIHTVPTPLEIQIDHIKCVQAKFYQKYYINYIINEKFKFDALLKIMKHKKVKLDYDLKIAEARMINLTEEFILAQKSVTMEVNLEHIVRQCTQEKRVCMNTMKTLQKGIDSYKSQLESIYAKRNALLKEVLEIATNAAPSYEKYLIRVFRKKISSKNRNQSDDDGDGSEDSDDSDESEDMALDEEEDDEDDLDVDLPPQDLKTWIYEAVVEVRGRRLALDEVEVKNRSSLDDLTTQVNGFKNRMNVADNTLKRTKQELDKFNLEKQFKLNSNEGEVSLNLHQIHFMHSDLEKGLVINKSDIKRLRDRIPELQKEKRTEKKRVLTTKNQYHRLNRDDKKYKYRVREYDSKCNMEMMRKFGRVKPIEELEQFHEDPEITRMKRELRDMQERHELTVLQLDKEAADVEEQETRLSQEQRETYNVLLGLHKNLSNINHAMEAGLSVMPQKADDESGLQDLMRVQLIVHHQRGMIEYLKQQIKLLTRHKSLQPLPPIPPSK